jgi:hypothetical protein
MPDRCRTCKAEVRWARLARSGRPHPLDAVPSKRGNLRLLDDGRAELLAGPELVAVRTAGAELFVSHFTSCPDCAEWRRWQRGNGARS